MKSKLNLSAMAKKIESTRNNELNARKMSRVLAGAKSKKEPVPWPYEWIESLCADWCSVGVQHFVDEFDDFDDSPDDET